MRKGPLFGSLLLTTIDHNHPRCLTCSFLREGQTKYIFLQLTKLEKSPAPYLATQKISYTW